MLQSLDTLIAFVVIMTIVSLFVTIIVQMVSSVLSLRGKNLANALSLTFQTIDPALRASAYQLAAHVLCDPLLSDSTRTEKDRGERTAPRRIGPWSALTFAFWRDDAFRLATAIRPEEVYDALKKIATGDAAKSLITISAENQLVAAQKALSALAVGADKTKALAALGEAELALTKSKKADSAQFDADLVAKQDKLRQALENIAASKDPEARKAAQLEHSTAQKDLDDFFANSLPGTARKLLAALGAPADKTSAAADKLSAFGKLAPIMPDAVKAQFDKALQDTSAQLVGIIDSERDKFESWFNSAQDRAQQWFQLHTRVVTVCASIFITFLFQLDAVEVFRYVSTNSAARAALVAKADAVVQQADGIVNEKGGLVQRIADEWTRANENYALPVGAAMPTNIVQLESELRQITKTRTPPMSDADFAVNFKASSDNAVKAYYAEKKVLLDNLGKEANAAGFDLIPTAFWRWPAGVPSNASIWNQWRHPHVFFTSRFVPYVTAYWSHFPGLVLFAALLTLGAPYWYNLLKNLTSLRPALAKIIGQEETAQEKTKP